VGVWWMFGGRECWVQAALFCELQRTVFLEVREVPVAVLHSRDTSGFELPFSVCCRSCLWRIAIVMEYFASVVARNGSLYLVAWDEKTWIDIELRSWERTYMTVDQCGLKVASSVLECIVHGEFSPRAHITRDHQTTSVLG